MESSQIKSRKIQGNNVKDGKLVRKKKKKDKFFKNSARLNRILAGEEEMDYYTEEAFNQLRTNVAYSFADDGKTRVIGITSSMRGEGKSFVACCVANSISKTGKKVLLIDGDLRLPTVSKKLRLVNYKGLSNLLTDSESDLSELVYTDVFGSVNVLTSGFIPPNPWELLGSERMEQLVQELSEQYDYLIFDLPPIGPVTDALIMAKYMDGLMLVVRHEHTDTTALHDTIRQARMIGAKMLGFVYNGKYLSAGAYSNKYYRYKYSNQYAYRE